MKSVKMIEKETESDVYSREDFAELVRMGAFLPYDGDGYFHDGKNRTDISVWDNTLIGNELKKYPYVCWYNR